MRAMIAGVAAALAAVVTCAGCASVSRVQPGAGAADSSAGAGSGTTGVASASAAPPDTSVSGPGVVVPPTGPAATAARGTPPPLGKQAVAHVGAATISCPTEPFVAGGTAGRQPLPAGATITAVVRCETVQRTYPGLGEWSVQLAEVADSGAAEFASLATELRKRSEPTPPDIACAAYLAILPWFAVIDDHGQLLSPALPTDRCGQYLPTVGQALAALDFRAVDAVRVSQTRGPEAITTGCDQRWKDMVAFEGARHPEGVGSASVADLAVAPSSVLVCLYDVVSTDGGVGEGQLVKGVTLTGEEATRVASEAMQTAPLSAGCAQAKQFAVIASSAYVELGGCLRVLTGDGRLGAASTALVAQVKAALGLS